MWGGGIMYCGSKHAQMLHEFTQAKRYVADVLQRDVGGILQQCLDAVYVVSVPR